MKAVVLAGGKGTRLAPFTKILPKPLMPIGEMPILEVLIHQLKYAGVNEVILTVGHLAQLLQAFFNDGSQFGVSIEYSFEDSPLGTAGPLSLIEGLDNTFMVLNGDVLTTLDFKKLVAYHKKEKAAATISMNVRKVNIDLGVIECNSDNSLHTYIEKPSYEYHVSMGVYVFEPSVLKYIPKGEYLDFPNLVQILLDNNERVVGYPFDGYWQDLGRRDDYEQASDDFEKMRHLFLREE